MGVREVSGKDSYYQFISPIGSGGFGSVTKVRRVRDGRVMACKSIDCSQHPELRKLASREIDVWAAFGAERYIASFSSDCAWNPATETIRIYMDYYEGGDLQRMIDTCRYEETTIFPLIATYWAVEIARGIKACHDNGIIHRDIKPQNILLALPYDWNDMLWAASESQNLPESDRMHAQAFRDWLVTRVPWCHLTDFGLGKFSVGAILSHNTNATYGVVGTPGYIAPEAMGEKPVFSSKSDIYSFGCLLHALFKCRPLPSLKLSGSKILQFPDHYPSRLQPLLDSCIETDPSKRPTSREVLNELSEAFVDMLMSEFWARTATTLNLRSGMGSCEEDQIEKSLSKLSWTTEVSSLEEAGSSEQTIGIVDPSRYPSSWSTLGPRRVPRRMHYKLFDTKSSRGSVTRIAFSPGSQEIAACGGDQCYIWNPLALPSERDLEGHDGKLSAVAYSPSGGLIAAGSLGKHVFVWNADEGQLGWNSGDGRKEESRVLHSIDTSSGVNSITFSADGKAIVSGSIDGSVTLWEISSGKKLRDFSKLDGEILSVALSPDGTLLAIGGSKVIALFTVKTGAHAFRMEQPSPCVAFSPTDRFLAALTGGKVTVWDISQSITAPETITIIEHEYQTHSFGFSPGGEYIATANDSISKNISLYLWDVYTGEIIKGLGSCSNQGPSMVAFAPNTMAVAAMSGGWLDVKRVW